MTQDISERCLPRLCSACIFWADLQEVDGIQVGTCMNEMVIQPTYGNRVNRTMRKDGVYTMDEGGGTGDLMTGPEFGCIHFEKRPLLWVTNHPKSLKGMWPRRIGAVYLEGPPKATEAHTAESLANDGLVGVYVDMAEEEYRKLPMARTPADMKPNKVVHDSHEN